MPLSSEISSALLKGAPLGHQRLRRTSAADMVLDRPLGTCDNV
jgi:hypothetical protein